MRDSSDPPDEPVFERLRPHLTRWGAAVLVVVAVLAGVVYWLSRSGQLEEALRLDDMLAEAVSEATDGRYLVDLSGMTVDMAEGLVVAHDVRLYPNPDDLPPDSVYRLVFTSPRVSLAGVQDWQLLVQEGRLMGGVIRAERPAFDVQRPADDLDYRAEFGDVTVDLPAGRASLRELSVFPVGRAGALDSTFQAFVHVPELTLGGVRDWRALADEGVLDADTLRIDRPQIHVKAGAPRAESEAAETADEDAPTVRERLARTLADVSLARLVVDQATVSYARRPDAERGDTLRSVSLRLDDLDPARHPDRPLLSEYFTLRFGAHRRVSDDGWYIRTIGAGRLDADGRLAVDAFSIRPTVSHSEMQRRLGRRKGQYDLATGGLVFTGVDLVRLIEADGLGAGRLTVDGLEFSYEDDMRWASGGPKGRGPKLPHEIVRRMDAYLRIDTVRVRGGRVAYRRYADDGVRPGVLAFDGLQAVAYNLTNDPARMSGSRPAQADVSARIAGSGRLRVWMRYNLLSPAFSLDYTATLADLQIPALNAMLVPSEGIEVTEGYTETLRINVRVRGGRATGVIEGRYYDFRLRLVDKEGNRGGVFRRFKSFVADNRVRSDNDGDDPRVGVIEHTYDGSASFFRFLWLGLRSGLESITGLDRF